MGKPHLVELRSRVIGYGDEGQGHHQAAQHFRVSPKFVNDMVKLRRESGGLTLRRQSNGGGRGRLVDVTGWLEARVTAKIRIILDELVAELVKTHGIGVHRAPVWHVLRGFGLTYKKRMAHPVCKRVEAVSFGSCTNISGIAVNQCMVPSPRWRSARSGPHKTAGIPSLRAVRAIF